MNSSSHRTPFILAIVLHALILIVLVVHLSSPDMRNLQLQPDVDIIKAVAVNPTDVASQITRIKAEEQKKQQKAQEEILKQQQEQARAQAELKRQQAEKAEKAAEAAKVAAQKKAQQAAEAAALLAQQQAEQKSLQEKQSVQKSTPTKQSQSTTTKDKKETNEKTKPDAAATKQTSKDSQKKQQQQKAAQELKLAQQKELDNQIAAEQKQLEAARTQEQQSEIDKYTALILQTMRQNWIVPDAVNPNISCQLAIRLNSDGTVVSVTLLRSSGNAALDNSARLAVFKSSPLPVPVDAKLFNQVFHQFNLTVSPKDIQE